MTPTKHPLCNDILRRPPGTTEEECGDLPIRREDGRVISFWKPSPEEIALIAKGHPVIFIAQGVTHPPVCLLVEDLEVASKQDPSDPCAASSHP
jgi:hypothetical protein